MTISEAIIEHIRETDEVDEHKARQVYYACVPLIWVNTLPATDSTRVYLGDRISYLRNDTHAKPQFWVRGEA